MQTARVDTKYSRIVALAAEFHASYTAERLQVRARHLLGAGKAFNSPRITLLAEAAFLALDWKSSLPAKTVLN